MKVVTICGSMKFKDKMIEIATELERKYGWCVLQCVYDLSKKFDEQEMERVEKAHYKKIDLSDAIYVLNIDNYIGNTTKKEIEYAKKLDKEVIYHEFNLVDQLNKYNPFNKDEKENVKNILDFLANNTNCYDRSNLKGHVTAGGLVVDGKGNVLLNHHKKTGMWFQFGGHSDGDTNCINVARREISEETGIFDCRLISNDIFDVDVQKIAFSAKKNEPEHLHFDINFLFFTKNKDFHISNESTKIKWVTIDEAKRLIDSNDQAMQRMILKYSKLCEKKIELHKPTVDELWFRRDCMADATTMSYNAGYDVKYDGYHRDTGCIDFPKRKWNNWVAEKLDNPNFFYAYILDIQTGKFVGYVNFNKNLETQRATMGIVIKDEFRGKGYMRPSIEKLIEKARELSVKSLTDTVPVNRQNALNVFYDLGFEKVGEFITKKFDKDELVYNIELKL